MILAYDNLGSGVKIQIFDDQKQLLDGLEIFPESQHPAERPDLLLEFSKLLKKNSIAPKDLQGILFLQGPGRFTPVRTGCILANILASQLSIPLYPLKVDQYQQYESDFSIAINHLPTPVGHVEAIFNAPPRITLPEKKELPENFRI